ncbi:Transglycosylase SLT domain 1 [uncultured Caudovirales phage]|uniref:Transglycosylase SLT domain 1 n=1 Tax=uncultured Caudovirales phage TaxID=2100421 RepID=A0A6J5RVR1_9CAUD|nr:Transglycosylase SLT domain 1 [uncultured Caudovirales phage]CAB4177714.1 Transglycosylase SLT domain 1 [uncultured Caudovirales phage]CAB4202470.1 Transglycosylase SLT domain 1 [uncultured Caudovirales phage]CAB5229218.1 Transglycosylase SLT domain 1 [uncultured Caudovirales phage]
MADYDDYLNQIMRKESSGVATAQNSRSTAGGLFQFINSTWGNTLRRMDPEAYGGMKDKELSALKSDPDLSWKAAKYHIANDIAPKFQKENIEMTPGRAYLAWFQGPQGAVNAIKSNPGSKVSDVFPETIKANENIKFNGKPYADWSMADLQSWADKKMVGVNEQVATPPAGATPPWSNPASALGSLDQKYLNGGLSWLASPITGLLGGGSPQPPPATPMPGQRQPDILAPVVGGDTRLETAGMTPMAAKELSGLSSLGNALMAAGAAKGPPTSMLSGVSYKPKVKDDLFAGLFGYMG